MSPNIADTHQQPYPSKLGRGPAESSEMRKTLKPLMEKRRRARINESLNLLKTLILPLIGKDSSRYSKLEKADILEMTVRFLKELPPAQPQASSESYREGYCACVSRVGSILSHSSLLDTDTCGRLLAHLQRSPELAPCQGCSSHRTPGCEQCTPPPQSGGPPRIVIRLNPTSRRAEVRPQAPTTGDPAPQTPNSPVWRPW